MHLPSATLVSTTEKVVKPQEKKPIDSTQQQKIGTAFVYDVRCCLHKNVIGEPDHVEAPERIIRIYETLRRNNLIEKMHRIKSRLIRSSEILMLHTQEHHDKIKETKSMDEKGLCKSSNNHESVYLSNDTDFSARLAAGSVCELIEQVLLKKHKNGIAIVRPPGHHAEPNEPILARDIHLGNGIQTAFINDPSVVYLSIHRYDNNNFYPQSTRGSSLYIGEPGAKGSTINVGWNQKGKGDSDYIYTFKNVVIPVIEEFKPSLVIVASGFDAAEGDVIGECNVTPKGYKAMTKMLKDVAGDRLIISLEGGYNLESISISALACVRALIEDVKPCEFEEPGEDTKFTISQVQYALSKYWKCFENAQDPCVEKDKAKFK